MAVGLAALLLVLLMALSHGLGRITMSQQDSCYYKPFHKELKCQCTGDQAFSYLHLRMEYFVKNANQEIRSVILESCSDLLVGLDLLHMNPSSVPFLFKSSGRVTIDFIKFDPKFADRQKLRLVFENVEAATLSSLHVDEAIQMSVENVKEFQLLKSTFSHLPALGLNVSRTGKLDIRDSIFLRVYPSSVVVEKTKKVEVVNNQFSINAIKVISTRDGSHLFISCNRLLGNPVTPECLPTTTTTTITTTTSTTPAPSILNQRQHTSPSPVHTQQKEQRAVDGEMIAGLVSGVTIVFLVLLATIGALCVRDRREVKRESEMPTEEVVRPQEEDKPYIPKPPTPPPMPTLDLESILGPGPLIMSDNRLKFSAPVWLDEIQNNKIFNKQRNLLVQVNTEVGEGQEDQIPRESSKTESDQESHTSV